MGSQLNVLFPAASRSFVPRSFKRPRRRKKKKRRRTHTHISSTAAGHPSCITVVPLMEPHRTVNDSRGYCLFFFAQLTESYVAIDRLTNQGRTRARAHRRQKRMAVDSTACKRRDKKSKHKAKTQTKHTSMRRTSLAAFFLSITDNLHPSPPWKGLLCRFLH